jgi:phosphoribosylformimino-5-aminoimidazole carboxamide ribotide isomerase
MDLMHGQVVRGVGGRRHEYRPLASPLCPDSRPATLAASLLSLGLRSAYLADLDSIQKGDGNTFSATHPASLSLYTELLRLGLDLWIDAGIAGPAEARELARFVVAGRPIAGIVAALESLADPEALAEVVCVVGPERLIFSLDLKGGMPLAGAAWRDLSPRQIAALALRAGVRRMIVLDLADVGVGAGTSTLPLLRALRALEPKLQLIAGGGVRGPADLEILARAGCDAALVASALHDGRLAPADRFVR